MLSSILDHAISILTGVALTLVGFRVIGPKRDKSSKYELFYSTWIKHLRWLGPLVVLIFSVHLGFAFLVRNRPATGESLKAEMRASVENSLSSDAKLAADDYVFESDEGFSILIPAGFTYSIPSKQIALAAICKSGDSTSAVILVSVERSALGTEAYIDQLKQTLLSNKHKTHRFSEIESFINGDVVLQVLKDRVVRDDGVAMQSMSLIASKEQKFLVATITVSEDEYGRHIDELDRVKASFRIR